MARFGRAFPIRAHLARPLVAQVLSRTATDALLGSDTAVGQPTKARTATDALLNGDTATRAALSFSRTTTDALLDGDTAAKAVARFRTATDALLGADTATQVPGKARTTTDALLGSDTATMVAVLTVVIAPFTPPAHRRYSGDELLDLPANLGQRIESIRYDILTADLVYAFTCSQVDRAENVPTIHFDANADTNRTMAGLWLGPDDADRIDPLTHLLAPKWVLDDGVSTYNMGVFHFANLPLELHSWGDVFLPDLYDSSVILNQARSASFSVGVGTLLTTAARQIIAEVGLSHRFAIDPSSAYATAPQLFAPGTTRRAILAKLCEAMAFYPPYFDNDGFLRLRAVPNPISDAHPDFTYTEDENSRIIRDSVKVSSNIVEAPNVYQVIGSLDAGGEVVGTFRVPASAPHSVEHRGFEVVMSVQNSDIHDQPAATAAAQAAYVNDFSTYVRVEAETSPDPRADGMQIVSFRNTNYREQSWDLECRPGGTMAHSWQNIWQP